MKLIQLIIFGLSFVPVLVMGQGVIIESGATLTQTGGNMLVNGDWVNNGTFNGDSGTVVFIGANQSVRGTSLSQFNNLTINASSIVNIMPQVNVTVDSALTNNNGNAGLVLRSNSSGTGSLIHNTAGVGATSQRYMYLNHWHIMSPSVSGQTISGFVTDAFNAIPTSGSNYGMMYYSEAGGGWVYYTDPAAGSMSVGTGYLARHTLDTAVQLLGTLNAANTDVSITKAANGWNCIGNPFPCSIGVVNLATTAENLLDYNAAELDPSFAVFYLWDEDTVRVSGVNYYKIISNAGFSSPLPVLDQAYMQPGQGFLVKSKTGGGTVHFTTDMRLHENTGFFLKSTRVSWPGLNLVVKSATKKATTAITYHKNMTLGLDVTYDAGLLGGDPSFKIYSRLVQDNGINFMLQCLPDEGFDKISIPLGLDFTTGGEVTFTADITSLPLGCRVILEDRLLQKFTDLEASTSMYTTTVTPNSTGIGRFYLHSFDATTGILNNSNSLAISIYTSDENIVVSGLVTIGTKANLYNMDGVLIKSYTLESADKNILPTTGIMHGVYILKVFGATVNENKKLLIQ